MKSDLNPYEMCRSVGKRQNDEARQVTAPSKRIALAWPRAMQRRPADLFPPEIHAFRH